MNSSIKMLLNDGCSITFGRLSVCNLGRYIPVRNDLKRKYQVDCDDSRLMFSEVYDDIDIAVDKFVGIKNNLIQRQYNEKRPSGKSKDVQSLPVQTVVAV